MKEEIVIKYFDIVLLSEKKDSFFDIYDSLVPKYLKVNTKSEKEYFFDLKDEIIEFAKYEKYFNQFPSGHCELTDKGKKAKKKGGHLQYEEYIEKQELESENKSINISIENLNQGENKGVLIQGSSLEKSPIKNKVNAEPNNKPEQKSFVKKIFSSGWTLAFVMLVIEEITLGKIWNSICSWFE